MLEEAGDAAEGTCLACVHSIDRSQLLDGRQPRQVICPATSRTTRPRRTFTVHAPLKVSSPTDMIEAHGPPHSENPISTSPLPHAPQTMGEHPPRNAEWHFLDAMSLLQQEEDDHDVDAEDGDCRSSREEEALAAMQPCLALLSQQQTQDGGAEVANLRYCAFLEMGRLLDGSASVDRRLRAAGHYARAAETVEGAAGNAGGVLRGAEARLLEGLALKAHEQDFEGAERALRAAMAAAAAVSAAAATAGQGKRPKEQRRRDGDRKNEKEEREREAEAGRHARLQLALLLLQKGGPAGGGEGDAAAVEADAVLHPLGFRTRLARGVLGYPLLSQLRPAHAKGNAAPSLALPSGLLVGVADDILPAPLLQELQGAFLDPGAAFWREHGYDRPDCPYFSYLQRYKPLPSFAAASPSPLCKNGVDALIHHVVRAVATLRPEVCVKQF